MCIRDRHNGVFGSRSSHPAIQSISVSFSFLQPILLTCMWLKPFCQAWLESYFFWALMMTWTFYSWIKCKLLTFLPEEFFALYFRWRMLSVGYNFKVGCAVRTRQRCHLNNDRGHFLSRFEDKTCVKCGQKSTGTGRGHQTVPLTFSTGRCSLLREKLARSASHPRWPGRSLLVSIRVLPDERLL